MAIRLIVGGAQNLTFMYICTGFHSSEGMQSTSIELPITSDRHLCISQHCRLKVLHYLTKI